MIIHRYLIAQVLKNQTALLLILLSIFSSQKLIRLLSEVVADQISARWLWSILGFGLPYMLQLIIPLSLFLSLLLTYGALYANQEMVALQASGFPNRRLLAVALWLALLSSIPAAINVGWLSPLSENHQRQVIQQATRQLGSALLIKGKFRRLGCDPWVIFVYDTQAGKINGLFAAQGKPVAGNDFSIWTAESGSLQEQVDGSRQLLLNQGIHYQGLSLQQPLQITQFKDYQASLAAPKPQRLEKEVEGRSLRWLWHSSYPAAQIELHWRLSLLACIPIMAILAVPLSRQSPRQHRMIRLLPALLLYLIYFLSQTLIRSALGKGQLVTVTWFWIVSGCYLLLALTLNARKHW
ncbi:MAG: LPS export ABC transporter permease LptF [Candidatus Symbiodolus clandestinus]